MDYSKSQTLITGVYRTGSEYLSKLMNTHPELSAMDYRINLMRFIYKRYDPIHNAENLNKCLDDLNQRLKDRYKLTVDKDQIVEQLNRREEINYGTLYDVLMSNLYVRNEIEHWAEKNQLLWREIPDFLNIMPNGKAIVIIRDPRSVLVSFKNYTYADPPAYLGAIFNCLDCMKAVKKYMEEYSNSRFTFVRYEDLARNPLEEVNKLNKMIGVKELTTLNTNNTEDAYGNEWKANSSFHPNKEMGSEAVKNSINRWEGRIESGELSLVEGVCGKMMDYFGYERSLEYIDWLGALKYFLGTDKNVTGYFENWLQSGNGIQAFPTDPTNSKNWEENQSSKI